MTYFKKRQDAEEKRVGNGHGSWLLLGESQGCKNGCCAGISYYRSVEYTPPAIHDDQEGFLVLSGTGWARIGTEEFEISPEMAFLAPAGVAHQIKSSSENCAVEVFWFHAKG